MMSYDVIQDSECYTIVIDQIAPADAGTDRSPLQVGDVLFDAPLTNLFTGTRPREEGRSHVETS